MFEEMEFLQGRYKIRKFYQKINKDRRKFKPKTMIKNGNNIIISNEKGIVSRWKKHFSELLTNDESQQNSLSEQQNRTEDENPLTLPAELFKTTGNAFIFWIHEIITNI